MNQNNKFIGYLQHGTKQQPNRTDSSNRLGAPVHILGNSTVLQDSPSWVYKGEWNGTIGQNMFAEFRAGQFGYNFGLDSNTTDTRYESLTTNEILGGGRDWELRRRRNQYTGARQLLQGQLRSAARTPSSSAASTSTRRARRSGIRTYADNVIHFVNGSLANGPAGATPAAVRLANNADSWSALATTSLFVTDTWVDRAAHAERRRAVRSLSRLAARAVAACRPLRAGGADLRRGLRVVVFNHIVPRLGATYDLLGDGRTVLKGNWGRFYFNPGVNLADSVNPNTANQYPDRVWNDLNNDRIFQEGEAGRRCRHAFGGVANAAIDPEPRERLHRRSVGVRRARRDERPRRPRRVRLEEGQERLAAGERRCGRSAPSTCRSRSSIRGPTAT